VLLAREKTPAWRRFLAKFADPLILILLVAGMLSMGIALYEHLALDKGLEAFFEPLGIFVAILLATGLAFYFERKADKEFSLLSQVNDDEPVTVIRDGEPRRVTRREVVVGDVVKLAAGEEVPADGSLLKAVDLTVDESSLTGEPLCHKTVRPEEFDKEATFPSNQVLRGTRVLEGHALMEVTAVGMATEHGRVYEAVQLDDHVKTPLSKQLDGLALLITRVSYALAGLVIVGRLCVYFTQGSPLDSEEGWMDFLTYLFQTVMLAVTLIVVAVPEGLPMAVTLSLAYSVRRMLRTGCLVRSLHASETMGAVTVICTDKTGTLTQNRMTVTQCKLAEGREEAILHCVCLCNTAELNCSNPEEPVIVGNPLEGALLLKEYQRGFDYRALRNQVELLAEEPFTSEKKYMSVTVRTASGEVVRYVKGAPEIVASLCGEYAAPLTAERVAEECRLMQGQALRTLGLAYQPEGADSLIYLGSLGLEDPVRPEVAAALDECLTAGVYPLIVTGDSMTTAQQVARQLRLLHEDSAPEKCITGPELAALTDEELAERIQSLSLMARARPQDKRRLVEALQAAGEVVAVTGDGTNDAPALKAAHVGLSMGDGTMVAKEASDITILDNSFASISRAILWGRSLYRNIQHFLVFQLTVNVVACLVVLVGAFTGTTSPLNVTQMLWVNLIMDTFAAMAFSSLPPNKRLMQLPPRDPEDFILGFDQLVTVGWQAGVFFLASLAVLWVWGRDGLSTYERTEFFTYFVLLQWLNMLIVRMFLDGTFVTSKEFKLVLGMIVLGQVLIVNFGGDLFGVEPISLLDWCILFLMAVGTMGLSYLLAWVVPKAFVGLMSVAWKAFIQRKTTN
jgi:Ca2+-transporting ATPase